MAATAFSMVPWAVMMTILVSGGDAAAVLHDDVLADRQAQAVATGLGGEERAEQARQDLGVQPGAPIRHLEHHLVAAALERPAHRQLDAAAGGDRLGGVADQ